MQNIDIAPERSSTSYYKLEDSFFLSPYITRGQKFTKLLTFPCAALPKTGRLKNVTSCC